MLVRFVFYITYIICNLMLLILTLFIISVYPSVCNCYSYLFVLPVCVLVQMTVYTSFKISTVMCWVVFI